MAPGVPGEVWPPTTHYCTFVLLTQPHQCSQCIVGCQLVTTMASTLAWPTQSKAWVARAKMSVLSVTRGSPPLHGYLLSINVGDRVFRTPGVNYVPTVNIMYLGKLPDVDKYFLSLVSFY